VLEEAIEEQLRQLIAEHVAECLALRLLVGWVTGDKVLHVQPATQAEAAQDHRLPISVDKLIALDGQHRRLYGSGHLPPAYGKRPPAARRAWSSAARRRSEAAEGLARGDLSQAIDAVARGTA
jgi:hypothetical protein